MNYKENTNTKYKIVFSQKVDLQLQNIYDYLDNYNSTASKKLMAKIADYVKHLDVFPRMYPKVQKGYRKINIDEYLIFYSVNEKQKEVYILSAHHGAQDYGNCLDF